MYLNKHKRMVGSSQKLNCGSPLAISGAEPDLLAPSASSPVLTSFVVEEQSALPWAVSELVPGGNLMSPNGLKKLGLGVVSDLQGMLGVDGATERPASPRSPLLFEEATVLPASPRSPRTPLPPPYLQSKSSAKRLRVYSRHHLRSQ